MGVTRLELRRFGPFTDRLLDLEDPAVRLHLVVGPNEAGKSTARAAVGDLLFGIHERSSYDFVHPYREMSLAAELEGPDGSRLFVERRKQRKASLRDRDGEALPDDVLAPLLGGLDRVGFEGRFSLDHAGLRAGGRAMLEAEGEVGQSLFAASAGLHDLTLRLKRLDDEADALFKPAKSRSRPFWQAHEAYEDARRRLRADALGSEEWRRLETDLADLDRAVRELRGRLDERRAGQSRVARLRAVLAPLRRLGEARGRLADLAGHVALPAEAGERFRTAEAAYRRAAEDRDRLARDRAGLAAELDGLAPPQRLLARAGEVARLQRDLGAVEQAAEDRVRLAGQRDDARQRREELTARLPRAVRAALADGARPGAADLDRLRRQLAARDVQASGLDDARRRLEDAEAALAEAARQLEAAPPPADPLPLAGAIDTAQAPGPVEQAAARARQELERRRRQADDALAALPLWQGDAAALARLAVPMPETVDAWAARSERAREAMEEAEREIRRADEAVAARRRELDELTGAQDLPTPDAVAAARALRDRGWSLVRRAYVDRLVPPATETEAFAAGRDLADAYADAVVAADRLADRRDAESERVAQHGLLRAQLDQQARDLDRWRARRDELAAEAERIAGDWRALWPALAGGPGSPREMAAWLVRRERVLELVAAAGEAAGRHGDAERDVGFVHRTLVDCLAAHGEAVGDGVAVEPLLRHARALRARLDEQAAAHDRLRRERDQARARRDREARQADRLAAALADWQAGWSRVLADVGLPGDLDVGDAEQVLATIADLLDADRTITDRERRIAGIDARRAAFRDTVAALLRDVAPEVDCTDAGAATATLGLRLAEAERAEARRADLARRIVVIDATAAEADAALRAAEAALAALRRLAGVGDDADLATAVRCGIERGAAGALVAELERDILASGDGRDLAALEAEADGQEPDRLRADEQALADEIATLEAEHQSLTERRARLGGERDQVAGRRDAAEAAADMQAAAAELREVTQRWLRLKAAATMLRRAVETFRQQQQNPLLARASDLFRALTLGRFASIRVDDEEQPPVLKGVRPAPDGAWLAVEAMSEGTRDQLYLALRLAAIEHDVAGGRGVPVIADDLLVTFDDERASAGLQALCGLGAGTQVLVFTHHRHLLDLAARHLPDGCWRIHELG